MGKKAPRIPEESWNRHKEEIICLYLDPNSTLDQTMQLMKERYGFQPSKNQYTTKLKAWGVAKYATGQTWEYIDKKTKKRKSEGKDSDVVVHGRKRPRHEVEKEIARHVPTVRQLATVEDIPTPDGVSIRTPRDLQAHSHPGIYIDNLPWILFKQEAQPFMQRMLSSLLLRYNPAAPETNVTTTTSDDSPHGTDSAGVSGEVSNESGLDKGKRVAASLSVPRKDFPVDVIDETDHSCVPPDLTDAIMAKPKPKSTADHYWVGSSSAECLIYSFVFQLANNLLERHEIDKGLDWIVENIGFDVHAVLFKVETTYMKVIAREIFYSAVRVGNTPLVRKLIENNASAPVQIRREAMGLNFWAPERLPTLSTILSFGTDPECFIEDKEKGFPLVDASLNGSLEAVKLLLHHGARVNRYLPRHYGTALQAATSARHFGLTEYLIHCGADINAPCGVAYQNLLAKDPRGLVENRALQTPIQIAAQQDDTRLVQLLLSHGAHPSACLSSPDTRSSASITGPPIQYAAQNGNFDLVCLLLSAGADPDSREAPNRGGTPLQVSARSGNLEITRRLLQAGANVNTPAPADYNGRTAIQAAAESGNLQTVKLLLLEGADLNAPPAYYRGMTALQAAACEGDNRMVGFLHTKGADINAAPAALRGSTTLQAAVSRRHLPLVQNLVKHGADINAPASRFGATALQEASRRCWFEGAEYLLSNGANIKSSDSDDCLSPLGFSIWNNTKAMVKWLLNRGADPLAPVSDEAGESSALLLALEAGADSEVVSWLLNREPDLNCLMRNEDALALAVCGSWDSGNIEPIRMIANKIAALPKRSKDRQIRHAWNALPPLGADASVNTEYAVEIHAILLNAGADINAKHPRSKDTLLQRMISRQNPELAKVLVFEGADVNCTPGFEVGTPLQEALKGGELMDPEMQFPDPEMANLLLDRGADVNAPPAERLGVTALQAAAINGLFRIVVRLLECGASVAAPAAPILGRTAIDGAAERGRLDILQLLLNAYDGEEDLRDVCKSAAWYAEKERHIEIAEWLAEYPGN